jgi:hypothetical protein
MEANLWHNNLLRSELEKGGFESGKLIVVGDLAGAKLAADGVGESEANLALAVAPGDAYGGDNG